MGRKGRGKSDRGGDEGDGQKKGKEEGQVK